MNENSIWKILEPSASTNLVQRSKPCQIVKQNSLRLNLLENETNFKFRNVHSTQNYTRHLREKWVNFCRKTFRGFSISEINHEFQFCEHQPQNASSFTPAATFNGPRSTFCASHIELAIIWNEFLGSLYERIKSWAICTQCSNRFCITRWSEKTKEPG